jgi:hypothetical protein
MFDAGDDDGFQFGKWRKSTCGLVILGFCVTAGVGMTIGGCAAGRNYLALLLFIPAGLSLICQFGIHKTSQEGVENPRIGLTGWVFLLGAFLTTMVAIPIVFWNVFNLKPITCGLPVGGATVIMIGYVVCAFLQGAEDSDEVVGFF